MTQEPLATSNDGGPGLGARVAALVAALALIAGGCAQKGFPPGGPRDTTPPTILSVSPDSGSSGVPVTSPISMAFGEKMDRGSVEESFYLTPRTDMESLRWSKDVLTAYPAMGLRDTTTYTVLLRAGVKDRRGNATRHPVVVHFSTGDSIRPGTVEGEVKTGKRRAQTVMVWAYDSSNCPPDFEDSPPEGVAQAGAGGAFMLRGLDVRRSYCVYAHLDVEGDGALNDDDLFIGADSLVVFSPDSATVSGVDIYLVPEDEAGTISGAVVDSSGPRSEPEGAFQVTAPESTLAAAADSLALELARADSAYLAAEVIVTATDRADSTNFVQTEAGADGKFTLKGVEPGVYRILAFRDLNGNRSWQAGEEPAAARDGLVVRPGRECTAGVLVLRIDCEEAVAR
jgi:uncharacterized protein (DUF2141 family)